MMEHRRKLRNKLMEMKKNSKRKKIRKTKRKKELKQKGNKTKGSHLGCLQRLLRGRQQLPSLLSTPQSRKKGKEGGKPHYISKQETTQ